MSSLYGRHEELALMREYLDRAVAGEQQLVLLEGDPGIGKSALLRAFAQTHSRWDPRRPRILYLQPPDGEAYEPVRHAALAATSRRIYARVGGKRQATEVARDLLPEWLGAIPVGGELIAALTATWSALQRRRRRYSVEVVRTVDEDIEALLEAARRRPLVLLLDGLERADRGEIARLEALIRTADEGARILIVGAYCPTAPGVPDPPVHILRTTLPEDDELFEYRRLGPLERDAVQAWLSARFPGATLPGPFFDWLLGASGGHPGTIESTLGHLLETGKIRQADGRWHFDTGPDRLHLPLIGESFADLSAINPQIAEVVQAASVLGEKFDAASLAALLQRDELAVEDQLALAVHLGLLELLGERTLPEGDLTTAYRFPLPHLRVALCHGFPQQRRDGLEERAALPAGGSVVPGRHPPSTSIQGDL
jgi:predicted ATPase